jgi:hypothetical protein
VPCDIEHDNAKSSRAQKSPIVILQKPGQERRAGRAGAIDIYIRGNKRDGEPRALA